MNAIKAKRTKRLTKGVHYLKDKLGLPVNYTDVEFSAFKQSLDWSRLPHDRIRVLCVIFSNQDDHIKTYVSEAEEIAIEEKNELSRGAFRGVGNPMGRTDRITLYAAIRAARPKVVVETGTAAGASATYILEALERNGQGRLYSVDVEHRDRLSGHLIPEHLRARVHMRTGDSLSVLPELLQEAGNVDFFLHDSLHTYVHMMAEYEMVYQHMRHGGVICSHDVLLTNAWKHFIKRYRLQKWGMVKNLGICLIEN
jgi:predicted O-methyltransferase YrrM